jgi:hypothetical protein
MIQRVQSIYLFLASVVLFALFFFPVVHNVIIDGASKTIKVDGIYQDAGGQLVRSTSFLALTIVTVILAILPLVVIFRYKKLKQQIALCYSLILVIIGYSFWMSQTVQQFMNGQQITTNNWGIGMLLSSISIVFLILAARAIGRDEKLLKSADRLR